MLCTPPVIAGDQRERNSATGRYERHYRKQGTPAAHSNRQQRADQRGADNRAESAHCQRVADARAARRKAIAKRRNPIQRDLRSDGEKTCEKARRGECPEAELAQQDDPGQRHTGAGIGDNNDGAVVDPIEYADQRATRRTTHIE